MKGSHVGACSLQEGVETGPETPPAYDLISSEAVPEQEQGLTTSKLQKVKDFWEQRQKGVLGGAHVPYREIRLLSFSSNH